MSTAERADVNPTAKCSAFYRLICAMVCHLPARL